MSGMRDWFIDWKGWCWSPCAPWLFRGGSKRWCCKVWTAGTCHESSQHSHL